MVGPWLCVINGESASCILKIANCFMLIAQDFIPRTMFTVVEVVTTEGCSALLVLQKLLMWGAFSGSIFGF